MNVAADEFKRCKKWIEDALEYSGGTHEIEDVFRGILEGKMQLWPAPDGCLVTEIIVYPRKKVLHIFLAGGKLDQLTDMHDDVIRWAKSYDCSALTLSGRKGWERALLGHGWKPTFVTLSKEI